MPTPTHVSPRRARSLPARPARLSSAQVGLVCLGRVPGRARVGMGHLVVGRACVHMSGSMDGLCYMKYAKPTGHVPQLVMTHGTTPKVVSKADFYD